jgi:aryl-alcohol dehydrogenase-like predicted oxidoreductase
MSRQAEAFEIDTEYSAIAGTPLRVSSVAIGTWAIGGWMWGGTDEAESVATIRAALDHGINVIDTAPAYGDRIMQEIEDSMRRLRTDYIDVYQVHWPDPLVPIEETAAAMQKLFKQGKIRAIGVSNFSVEQMEQFRNVAPLHVLQSPYNLFEREIEADLLPYCRRNNISTFGYGALCRGLLSGRMRSDTVFTGDDLRRTDPKFQQPRFAQYLSAVQRLDQLAQGRFGKHVIQLAVRWMLDQGITTALWGARHPGQLEPVDEVTGWQLDAPTRTEIDRILRETITDPVGPEFMAPPARAS